MINFSNIEVCDIFLVWEGRWYFYFYLKFGHGRCYFISQMENLFLAMQKMTKAFLKFDRRLKGTEFTFIGCVCSQRFSQPRTKLLINI